MLHFPLGQAALLKINHNVASIIRRNISLIINGTYILQISLVLRFVIRVTSHEL